jgi:hypothetical protein
MYAAIRQYKSKPGMADRLAERIKEAIPLISEVSGFVAITQITVANARSPARPSRSPVPRRSTLRVADAGRGKARFNFDIGIFVH